MNASDKAEEYRGRAKEALGDLTDNNRLRSEGQTDQASSSVKQTIDDVATKAKDTVQSAKERISDDN